MSGCAGVRSSHVAKAGKTGAVFLHIRNRARGHQFGALPTEEVGE